MNDIGSALYHAPSYMRIDDSWIGLLVAAIFIFVSSAIAIVVLCFLWRRYQQRTKFSNESYMLSNKPSGKRQIPIQFEDQQPKSYETQKMEVFVPQGDDEGIRRNLGEVHPRFAPHDGGIQQVHQFYERTMKAYF